MGGYSPFLGRLLLVLYNRGRTLPVGTAYCVFTGLGALGTVVTETALFGMPLEPVKIVLIALLMAGIMGLKLCTDGGKN